MQWVNNLFSLCEGTVLTFTILQCLGRTCLAVKFQVESGWYREFSPCNQPGTDGLMATRQFVPPCSNTTVYKYKDRRCFGFLENSLNSTKMEKAHPKVVAKHDDLVGMYEHA